MRGNLKVNAATTKRIMFKQIIIVVPSIPVGVAVGDAVGDAVGEAVGDAERWKEENRIVTYIEVI